MGCNCGVTYNRKAAIGGVVAPATTPSPASSESSSAPAAPRPRRRGRGFRIPQPR